MIGSGSPGLYVYVAVMEAECEFSERHILERLDENWRDNYLHGFIQVLNHMVSLPVHEEII